MYNFFYYFLLFFIYSVFGYILECTYCTIRNNIIILNRGFLVGPYLPIYGFGALAITFFLNEYLRDPIVLFIMACFIATLLEYITSVVMEFIFKARWWDYSKEKFNVNGRVCLLNTVLFGFGGLIIMYLINPLFLLTLDSLKDILLIIIGIVFLTMFIVDIIVSSTTIYKLRTNSIRINKELQGEISKQLNARLHKNRYFKKRLLNAFPNVKNIKVYNKINEIIQNKNN